MDPDVYVDTLTLCERSRDRWRRTARKLAYIVLVETAALITVAITMLPRHP